MNSTIRSVIAQVVAGERPALARALASYVYVIEHVSGGEPHAAEHNARAEVKAAAPGVDVATLIAAYRRVRERAQRYTTVAWDCGDSIVVEGGIGTPVEVQSIRLGDSRQPVTRTQIEQAEQIRREHVRRAIEAA